MIPARELPPECGRRGACSAAARSYDRFLKVQSAVRHAVLRWRPITGSRKMTRLKGFTSTFALAGCAFFVVNLCIAQHLPPLPDAVIFGAAAATASEAIGYLRGKKRRNY